MYTAISFESSGDFASLVLVISCRSKYYKTLWTRCERKTIDFAHVFLLCIEFFLSRSNELYVHQPQLDYLLIDKFVDKRQMKIVVIWHTFLKPYLS